MRRRKRPEPLLPRPEAAWLVVRDQLSQIVEYTPLEPHRDLRAVLTAARETRIADGWQCEDIGTSVGFFFCRRGTLRYLVAIEARKPPPIGKRW